MSLSIFIGACEGYYMDISYVNDLFLKGHMECPIQFSLELVKATTWTFHKNKIKLTTNTMSQQKTKNQSIEWSCLVVQRYNKKKLTFGCQKIR
jgi:hypothetical protein